MKILIVDDKQENLILLDTLLKGFGYSVEQAINGQEALEKLKNDSFQMVISDILMPIMDGYELCQICKTDPELSKLIFVFYTATYTSKEDEEYALQLGADGFFIKPMQPDLFMAAIRKVAEEAEEKKVSAKHQEITDIEALKIHRDRLLKKLNDKIAELESEITEREKTEEKYYKLMDFNPEAIIIHCEGKIVYANRAACKFLEADCPDSVFGEQILDFVHPEDHDLVVERIHKLLTGSSYEQAVEEKFISFKGRTIYAEVISLPNIYNGKQAIQVLARDITERKKTEAALKKSEIRYQTLAEISPVGIFRDDVEGNTIYVNKKYGEISGQKSEESLGKGWLNAIHADDRLRLSREWMEAIQAQNATKTEYRFVKPDGNIAWVIGQAVPEKDENGRILSYVGTVTDITEHKMAEEQVQKDLDEKEALLKEVHHRVKNNMQVIISIINLQLKFIHNREAKDILVESQNRIRSMALVHNILYQSGNLSKIDMGKYLYQLIANLQKAYYMDPNQVQLKTDTHHHSLSLEMAVPCGLLMNELVSNALKHAFPDERKGEIEVDLQHAHNLYTLTIRDTGIGLPEDVDIHNPTSFGMLMVKALTEQLNGTCEVRRESGTKYTIVFKEIAHPKRHETH